jgi:DNA-binding beta-propeller fold protein YncE
VIERINLAIEEIRRRGIIGSGSSTISVIEVLLPQVIDEIPISEPVDLIVDSEKNLYILSSLNKIVIYDKDGNFLFTVFLPATTPRGIALDKDGSLYIADTGGDRVLKMKRTHPELFDFRLDDTFGAGGILRGREPHKFESPWGVTVDGDGNLYVTEKGNNRVQKFDRKGRFIRKWGTLGVEPGELREPKGIFAHPYIGRIYVIDSGNDRVQEFSPGGALWSLFGEPGSDEGQFKSPHDIAIDPYYIYIADTGNNRVQKFSEERGFISEIANLNLSAPQAVAIVSDPIRKLIYIADTGNNRVVKVEIPIVPPEETWNEMKEALKDGDIEAALTHFSVGSKERYREIFTLLENELPRIAEEMEDIQRIYIRGDVAKYRIRRLEGGIQITYYIYFIKDEEGNWKIRQF